MSVVLYFSGSVTLDENTLFQSTTNDSPPIKLSEWLKLSQEQQEDYILENAIEAIRSGVDDEWEQLDLIKEV